MLRVSLILPDGVVPGLHAARQRAGRPPEPGKSAAPPPSQKPNKKKRKNKEIRATRTSTPPTRSSSRGRPTANRRDLEDDHEDDREDGKRNGDAGELRGFVEKLGALGVQSVA